MSQRDPEIEPMLRAERAQRSSAIGVILRSGCVFVLIGGLIFVVLVLCNLPPLP